MIREITLYHCHQGMIDVATTTTAPFGPLTGSSKGFRECDYAAGEQRDWAMPKG